jgi:hypothetical protein
MQMQAKVVAAVWPCGAVKSSSNIRTRALIFCFYFYRSSTAPEPLQTVAGGERFSFGLLSSQLTRGDSIRQSWSDEETLRSALFTRTRKDPSRYMSAGAVRSTSKVELDEEYLSASIALPALFPAFSWQCCRLMETSSVSVCRIVQAKQNRSTLV